MISNASYCNDGFIQRTNYIVKSTKLRDLDPDEYSFSRIAFYCVGFGDNNWGCYDIENNVVSIAFSHSHKETFHLCTDGTVICSKPGHEQTDQVGDRTLGALKQIRFIKDTVYTCGLSGQIYRRTAKGWEHFDQGVLDKNDKTAPTLNGIDGTGPDDLWVVGYHGRIFHRDAKGWRELDRPTNRHLERVMCVAKDEVYLCGNKGTFFRGNADGFEDFSVPGLEDHFWGIAKFKDKVYLATLNGLHVFDGTQVLPLSTGLDPEIGGYRLDANDEQLWSFGADDLACFDGTTWTRVVDPDNA